jgi:hypothetical protein
MRDSAPHLNPDSIIIPALEAPVNIDKGDKN